MDIIFKQIIKKQELLNLLFFPPLIQNTTDSVEIVQNIAVFISVSSKQQLKSLIVKISDNI